MIAPGKDSLKMDEKKTRYEEFGVSGENLQWHEFQAAMATHNCSGAVEHAYTEAPAILERA